MNNEGSPVSFPAAGRAASKGKLAKQRYAIFTTQVRGQGLVVVSIEQHLKVRVRAGRSGHHAQRAGHRRT